MLDFSLSNTEDVNQRKKRTGMLCPSLSSQIQIIERQQAIILQTCVFFDSIMRPWDVLI